MKHRKMLAVWKRIEEIYDIILTNDTRRFDTISTHIKWLYKNRGKYRIAKITTVKAPGLLVWAGNIQILLSFPKRDINCKKVRDGMLLIKQVVENA